MIHKALKAVRVYHSVKQVELADRLGISTSYMSEIESGKKPPTWELLVLYSFAFEIPVSAIIFIAERISKNHQGSRTVVTHKASRIIKQLEDAAQTDLQNKNS